jgi:beta-lactamase class A
MLRNWLIESRTGLGRIRSGLPAEWTAGDKTGTCGGAGRSAYNDVAFIQPNGPNGDGFLLAVFLDEPKGGAGEAEAALAKIARSAVPIIHAK